MPQHHFQGTTLKQLWLSSSADSSATQGSFNAAATLSHCDYTSLTLTALFDQGCGVYAPSPLEKYFSAQIWISLWVHPSSSSSLSTSFPSFSSSSFSHVDLDCEKQSYQGTTECPRVWLLIKDKPEDSVIFKNLWISLTSLIFSCHLTFLPTFFPPFVFLSLSLSGLHPLQNSYCPGQRGDRLLLLEDDCLQRDQDREWISTSNRVLTITFILKCQPCTPPKPTFCVQVFFSKWG